MDGWKFLFRRFSTICYLVLFRETANQRYTANDMNSNSFSNSEERKMARRCIFNIRI